MTAGCKKPAPEELPPLYAELKAASKPFGDLQAPKGGTKDGDVCNAVRGFEQGASAFSWPLAATGGVDTVAQGLDSSGLYVMRASKAAKEAGEAKKALLGTCLAYNAAVKAMQEWVKENAKMGLVWNAKGAAVKDWAGVAAGGSGGGGGGGGGAAAAPAPAAAPAAAPAPAAPTPAGGADAPATPNLGALFSSIASIDQSSGRTAGLRKVTKEMKSGGALGPGSAAAGGGGTPTPTPTPPATTPRPAAGGVKMGAPKLAEEGMRWVCEFHTKDTQQGAILTIGGASIKQEVYIYGCRDVVIDITTKVKGVRLDSCHNVQLLVQGALSGMEVVNSKRMKLQVKDRLPSVAIDKTDGIVVGLPWTSRDAIITSSKSSEMNVTFPLSDAADADWVEKAIPEQYVSVRAACAQTPAERTPQRPRYFFVFKPTDVLPSPHFPSLCRKSQRTTRLRAPCPTSTPTRKKS
jgi:adenylyl cyclase-associated protein